MGREGVWRVERGVMVWLGDVVSLSVPRRGTTRQLLHHYHVVCNGSSSRRGWDPLSQGFLEGRAREVGAGHQAPSC